MRKAPEAFRTISEAAEALDTPAHVLRFWESKFTQIKPVKRAGGRRYYRPIDIDLLSGIKLLLHDQGMTIRGVQKLLQEKGARHIAAMAPLSGDMVEAAAVPILRVVPDMPEGSADDTVQTPAQANTDAQDAVHDSMANLPDRQPAQSMDDERATADGPDTPNDTDTAVPEPSQRVAAAPDESDDAAPDMPQASAQSPADTDTPAEQNDPSDLAPAPAPPHVAVADNDEGDEDGNLPEPALAALLDAAAGHADPARFAKIAHALRTNPPESVKSYAPALARLEALVEKLTARAT